MEKITPSEYLRLARQDFQKLPGGICDIFLNMVRVSDGGAQQLFIPGDIPQKYHARMQAVWIVMTFNILFKNATDKYTLMQRHKMLQDAYRFQILTNQSER